MSSDLERMTPWELRAEVERLRAAVQAVRDLATYVDIWGASDYDRGWMNALDAVRVALDAEFSSDYGLDDEDTT